MAKKDIIKRKNNEVIREAKIEKENNCFQLSPLVITIISIGLIIVVIIGIILFLNDDKVNNNISDSEKFVTEYEAINGKETSYGGNYLEIDVSNDNGIKYTDYEEVFSILENETGVIYFGFPECPWCRNLVPVLIDAKDEVGLDTIYYFNNMEDRDIKELDDDGNIVTKKEGTKKYYKLVEKLESVLGSYKGLNNDSIKRLYYPTVIFVKDGKIVDYHIGTIESQENPSVELTKEQYNELKETLEEKMSKTIICDGSC